MSKVEKRNFGIDLLRIASMLAIVLGHLYGSYSVDYVNTDHFVVLGTNAIRAIVICGVDVFALISGYACYGVRFKLIRPVKLWCKSVFYALLLCVISGASVGGGVTCNYPGAQ